MPGPEPRGATVAVLLLSLSLLACISRGVQVREYVLTAGAAESGATAPRDVSIGVGPVKLPRYLRRVELATRVGPNQLRYEDTHRWGETLDKGLARVIASNLSALVPATRVATFPWRSKEEMDFRVVIEVERFEATPDGSSVLTVRWSVHDNRSDRVVSERANIAKESGGKDAAARVASMSRAADELSRQIAAAIRSRADFAAH
ncbi:MAG: PqiC family protein [Myxococcota bacterium]|nr:PqiC family protein [Myxococcota bacterium]